MQEVECFEKCIQDLLDFEFTPATEQTARKMYSVMLNNDSLWQEQGHNFSDLDVTYQTFFTFVCSRLAHCITEKEFLNNMGFTLGIAKLIKQALGVYRENLSIQNINLVEVSV